jgi:voltage-gated sodium channel
VQRHPVVFHSATPSKAKVSEEHVDDEGENADITKSFHAEHFARLTEADQTVDGSRKSLRTGSTYSDLSGVNYNSDLFGTDLQSHGATWTAIASFAHRLWLQQEPERSGPLADFVRSRCFERTIQVVILCNCLVMGLAANYEMDSAPTLSDEDFGHNAFMTLDIIFQLFYTLELILKLAVHRAYFFWNEDAGFNTFDCFLVVSGYLDLLFSGGGGSIALRTVRILKLGKALRALKVIVGFRTLRAILVCIQGSFITLLWSVLMLGIVFYIFSLIFVQQATSRLEDIGDRGDPVAVDIIDKFKSVQTSMMTLSKAAFGGEDWGVALDVVTECGFMSSFFYMVFISFSHIALINIITGIFVDNAMQSLSPNREQLATRLEQEEKAYAKELEKLCIDVDADKSGCLTKEQFNDGIKKGRIPLLLHLLGLTRRNVEHFFEVLCDATPDNQVDIKSFVRGCMRLKGAATSFDLQTMMLDLKKIERTIETEFRGMSKRIVTVERCMLSEQYDASPASKRPLGNGTEYNLFPEYSGSSTISGLLRDGEEDPV